MRFHDSVCIGWFVSRTTPELTPSVSVSLSLSLSSSHTLLERSRVHNRTPPFSIDLPPYPWGCLIIVMAPQSLSMVSYGRCHIHNPGIDMLRIFKYGEKVSHMICHV